MWKYLRDFFWKTIFALLKIVYWDIVEAFFKRKALEANANFFVFENQCPKIMVLSKTLKAKLSSIPSGIASLWMPDLKRNGKPPLSGLPAVATLLWAWGPVRGPLRWLCGCSREASSALSQWRRVFAYLWRCSRNLGEILRDLPKVSEVTTNHWVFLRCDWSPVSSWFYYRS